MGGFPSFRKCTSLTHAGEEMLFSPLFLSLSLTHTEEMKQKT